MIYRKGNSKMRKKLELKFKKEHLSHYGERVLLFSDINTGEGYYWRTTTHHIFIKGEQISCTARIKESNFLHNVRSIKIQKSI